MALRHDDPRIRRRRVAIASLMWGYGISGARWGDKWVSHVSEFLSPSLDATLEQCQESLSQGAIAAAYALFTRPGSGTTERERHPGVGIPFITKVLYFLARNCFEGKSIEYPLILDTKVSMALSQMTSYRLLLRPADYRPRPDSEAYARFVSAMHAWATRLNVLPEVIEYYLWREVGNSASSLWKACKAQYLINFP